MASRYWVGGSGTWVGLNTANWSATSGGAGGASVPTIADDVFFDANSGGGDIAGTGSAKTIDMRGFTGTFTSSGNTIILGSGNSYLSTAVGGLSGISFRGTATTLYGEGATVKSLDGSITVASSMTAVTLGQNSAFNSSLTVNSGVTLTAGMIRVYTQDFSCGGAGKIRLTGYFDVINYPLISLLSSSSTLSLYINCLIEAVGLTTSETFSFGTGAYSYGASGEIRLVKAGATYSIAASGTSSSNVLPTIHLYPETSGYVAVRVDRNYALHVKDVKSTSSGSGAQNFFLSNADTLGLTAQVVTYSTSASFNNVNLRNIAASGQPISGTRVGDIGGNSGVTLSASSNVYRIATGNYDAANSWSTSSGGAANANTPLPQDVAIFDAGTPTGTITIAGGINYYQSTSSYVAGFNATAYSGTIDDNTNLFTSSDQFLFGASTTLSSFAITSTATATAQIQCPNGGLTLTCTGASLNSASNVTLTATGAVTTNNYAHTLNLTLNGTATADFGTSAITLSGLSAATGATLTAASATFTTSGSIAISLNGKTLPNLTVSSATSFTTNATITSLTHSAGNISVTAAVTLTATAYTSPAPSASPPSLKCTTVGSTFTFNTSGAKVLQNLNLQGVDVPGTTYWNALNCINGGYNDAYILFNNNAGAIALF